MIIENLQIILQLLKKNKTKKLYTIINHINK